MASAHRVRVTNTHRRTGSASETVPCTVSAAPKLVHLHHTLRRARKRLLARLRAAARARALLAGRHAASAAFLKGVSRAAAVRRAGPTVHNSRHRGRTRQPAAAKTRPTHLKNDTITSDDAEDALGTRTEKPPTPRKHAKCTKRRSHLKHSTPTTQQARVGDTTGGFCVSR